MKTYPLQELFGGHGKVLRSGKDIFSIITTLTLYESFELSGDYGIVLVEHLLRFLMLFSRPLFGRVANLWPNCGQAIYFDCV